MDPKPKRPPIRSIDGFISSPRPLTPQIKPKPINSQIDKPVPYAPNNNQANNEPINFNRYYSPSDNGAVSPIRRPKSKKKFSKKKKVLMSLATLLIIGLGVSAWYGNQILGNIDKVFHGNIFSDVRALFSNTKLKGEDQGRVNVLLAGDSADDPNHGGAQLTDSIMLLSIDTKNHTGFMLSIPRDLWVSIGNGHQKINAANEVTNFSQSGYPKGGMGQLEQVLQTQLGIPINYYALIDYTAFKDSVNAVGGITINIQSDDPRGLFDPNIAKADGGPLKLPNGMVVLNGQTALNLARARGDPCYCGHYEYGFPNSDFNRTQHQRQMLTALELKAQSVGVMSNPIKVTNLFKALGNNVQTDLSIQEVLRFIQITKGMNVSNLQSLTLNNDGKNPLLAGYSAPDGESALIPKSGLDNFGQITQYYQQLTSNNPVVREAPSIVVLNGTGVNGLAKKESAILTSQGFNVVGTADAINLYDSSLVVDLTNGKKPATLQLLKTMFSKNSSTTNSISSSAQATEAKSFNADFVLIIGKNTNNIQQP